MGIADLRRLLDETVTRWRTRIRILKYLAGAELWLCVALILLILIIACTDVLGVAMIIPILGPEVAGKMVANNRMLSSLMNLVVGMSIAERLWFAGIALAAIVLLRSALQLTALYVRSLLPTRIELRLAKIAYQAILRVKYSFFSKQEMGELATVLIGYPPRSARILESYVNVIAQACAFMLFATTVFLLDPVMAFVAMCSLGAAALIVKWIFARRMTKVGQDQNTIGISASQLVYDTIHAMRLIRLRGCEPHFQEKHASTFGRMGEVKYRAVFLGGAPSPVFALVSGLTVAFVILTFAVFRGNDADIATLILFLVILSRMAAPVNAISSSLAAVRSMVPALAGFLEFMRAAENAKQETGAIPFRGLERDIVLENVTLRYGGAGDIPALTDLCLRIPKGSTVGIAGASGAGKSSLVAVLTRLQEVTSGRILVDGCNLKELRLDDWRSNLAVVTQESILLNDSVRNNLLFGKVGIEDQSLWRALELADAKEFVEELPERLDTVLGEAGVRLSGGQRQRLSLARALLQSAEIIILDEATSSLDSLTEVRIQESAMLSIASKTVIIIAHRLSTLRNADLIVVMDRGSIVEHGSHNDLMKLEGRYRAMVRSQDLHRNGMGPEENAA